MTTTTSSLTNLGPLTTTYTPTGTDCQSMYYVSSVSVLYGPSPEGTTFSGLSLLRGQIKTEECYPSGWKTPNHDYSLYYSPGLCPFGFTNACSNSGNGELTRATCCPSGYDCDYPNVSGWGRCTSELVVFSKSTVSYYLYNTVVPYTGDAVTSSSSSSSVVLMGPSSTPGGFWEYGITAYGVVVYNSAGDTNITSTASIISAGARAGIITGAVLGGLVIIGSIAAAFIIGRKRRRSLAPEKATPAPSTDEGTTHGPGKVAAQVSELDPDGKPAELSGQGILGESDTARSAAELHTNEEPMELEG